MPNKYYERAKRILSRNDNGPIVDFNREDEFYNLDDKIAAVPGDLTYYDKIRLYSQTQDVEERAKLNDAKRILDQVEEDLADAREEKKKYLAEHSGEDPETLNTEELDKKIDDLVVARREANRSWNNISKDNKEQREIRDAYKETYGKNTLANDGEKISRYKQRDNITSIVHLYSLASKANPPRTEEMEGYKQALNEKGIGLDYAFQLASGKLNVDTDQTKEELEDRIDKINQIDDTFLTQGKEALGVSVIGGVRTPNIDRVMSVYLQSGLSWKEFIGHIVYEGKDTSVFQEDEEALNRLGQEINDIENQIKEIKSDIEDETVFGKYADELEELDAAWKKAAENSENNPQEVGEDGDEKQITDLFVNMKYDLFDKLSPELEERIDVEKLLSSDVYKHATEEQRDIVRNTVKLFIDKEREKEEKTADLKKQLEEKEAEHTARSAKVNAINGKIADIKAAFKSESSLYINGESHAKNLFTPVKEFFIKNYPVEVQNHQMTIDDNLLKCTGKGMTEKVNAIEKAAERFSEFKSKELNKNASKEDVIKGKVDALLDVYKNNGKSFDERKMCLKAVLDRKNDLQSNLDGRNFFAKMFSAIVPNSWTEIGRLKNEINTLNNTIESVVSEQDIKDMYTDPIDEPRDPAKAEKLQPVFDYVKIVMDYAKAKGPVYDNIKKDIELMEGGVFAKGDKKCLDSLSDDLNIFLIDGKFEEELNVDDKRSFNAQVFNAFEAIKNFKENGVLEIKDVLSEMQNPEDTNELVEDLKDKTVGDKENRLSEATVDKSNEVKLDLNKTN